MSVSPVILGATTVADSAAPAGGSNALVILVAFLVVALVIAVVTVLLSRIGRR